MIIVMLGAPGSGKGTQAQLISSVLGMAKISMSALFRDEIKTGSALGAQLEKIMDAGSLVPDNITIELLNAKLRYNTALLKGCVLDGYPRTSAQAKHLDRLLEEMNIKIKVIDLVVTEEVLIKRFMGRYTCASCGASYHKEYHNPSKDGECDYCGSKDFMVRPDDSIEAVKLRLELYVKNTAQLIEHYARKGVLYEINGEQGIEEIFTDVKKVLQS
jgi:adenylate kinase